MNPAWRPRYHFLPATGWMNDPNGLLFRAGFHHLFFQRNPGGARWGDVHWGHARSRDLVRWERLPDALAPDRARGEAHCFSGGAAIGPDGRPILFYTSIGDGPDAIARGAEQWAALPDDDSLLAFGARRRILPAGGLAPFPLREWRDPYVWREGDRWLMVTGGATGTEGIVLLHSSPDALAWRFERVLFRDPARAPIECPNFFRLGDRWVLLYSPCDSVRWASGPWDGASEFRPDRGGPLSGGPRSTFYAPQCYAGPEGRRLLFGWLPEDARSLAPAPTDLGLADFGPADSGPTEFGQTDDGEGWAGMMSLPMELGLNARGDLLIGPAAELDSLRGATIFSGDAVALAGGIEAGRSFEATVADAGGITLEVLASRDGREGTRIELDAGRGLLRIDRSRSSLKPDADSSPVEHRFDPGLVRDVAGSGAGTGAPGANLRIFIDASAIEVYFAARCHLAARVYPTRADARNVRVVDTDRSGRVSIAGMNALSYLSV